jgi:uncharacterized protein
MHWTWKRIVAAILAIVLIAALIPVIIIAPTLYRVFVGLRVYETEPPVLPQTIARPALLVFSKTNGFRHEDAIPAAHTMFEGIARARTWGIYATENGAVFNAEQLARFDVVVFNNVSGDVFTPEQRQALQAYIENGGGFVGFHGSGGDSKYDWTWYVNDLIGAQFIGHPMNPQFQQATLRVEDTSHPASSRLSPEWPRTDEWYSFSASARRDGYHVLAGLDESTYNPANLAMGADHPMIWWHCQGRGRALYSALGHRAEAYSEPAHRQMLEGAVAWAARVEGEGCE